MKTNIKKTTHPLIFLSLSLLLYITLQKYLSPPVINAQGLNLSISPPLLQATIKPGKSISQVFNIENNSSNPIKLVPRIVPFLPEDDQGNPSLRPQSNPPWLSYFSLANSKIFLNKPFTLLANQKDQIVLSISIPEDAVFTDHYATLLVSSVSDDSNLSSTAIAGSIGSNILLTIADQAAPSTILKLTSFKPVKVKFLKLGQTYILDNFSPITFASQIDNLGQHQAQVHSLFQVKKKDRPVHIEPLLPLNVLAQSSRQLNASSSGEFSFTPKLTHLGRFKATINIRSESGSTQSSINILLLPVKALLGLTLSIALLKLVLDISQKKGGGRT
jgi:hypothetical protein